MASTYVLNENIKLTIDVILLERKCERLEKHMTNVLLDYQKCIQENRDLRKANDSLYKDLKDIREYACRMNVDYDTLKKKYAEMDEKNTGLYEDIRHLVRINSSLQYTIKVNPRF